MGTRRGANSGENQVPIEASHRDCLFDGPERQEVLRSHPFIKNAQLIATAQVKEIYTGISTVVDYRDTGICFQAPSRHGKTRACWACQELLLRNHPEIPTFFTTAKGHDRSVQTEKALWGDILEDINHPGAQGSRTQDRKKNLLTRFHASCTKTGGDQIVLFVDEAQNWGIDEWGSLKDLANSLEIRPFGIDLTVASFAQTELSEVLDQLVAKKRLDIIGRFFLDHRIFAGITSCEENDVILESFDKSESMEYPINSNISYSHFFFPKAFEAGWRLKNERNRLWKAIIRAWTPKNDVDVGMAAMIAVLKCFFLAESKNDSETFKGTQAMWNMAIETSPFRRLQLNGSH